MNKITNIYIRTCRQIECPICGGRGSALHSMVEDYYFGSPGSWSLSKCSANCGSIWLDPMPIPEDIGMAYLNYHTHLNSDKKIVQINWRRFYEKLINLKLRFCPLFRKILSERKQYRYMFLKDQAVGRLLDVGCGGGRYLRRMQNLGWEVEGVDFDVKATERVRKKYGIKTYEGDLRELGIAHESFDAIVMNHAIEHVIDPVSLLAECNNLLKPGGKLVIVTPNASSVAHRRFGKYWRGLEIPRHIQVFTLKGLDICLGRAGFLNRNITTFSHHSEGIYRVSEELRARMLFIPYNSLRSTVKSIIYMLAEYKYLIKSPNSGEDILAIAIKSISNKT